MVCRKGLEEMDTTCGVAVEMFDDEREVFSVFSPIFPPLISRFMVITPEDPETVSGRVRRREDAIRRWGVGGRRGVARHSCPSAPSECNQSTSVKLLLRFSFSLSFSLSFAPGESCGRRRGGVGESIVCVVYLLALLLLLG